jgi:threonine/homoserine/homoserine lactone efflux protein
MLWFGGMSADWLQSSGMFDSSFKTFVIMAAALVISPGASMAVVTEMALQRGRFAALLTVVGVNIANSSLALASMFGLSAVFHQWPSLLRAVSIGGAIYLTYLGLRTLWQQAHGYAQPGPGRLNPAPTMEPSAVVRGVLTNFLNPSVVLFYMLLLPQFISAADPFFRRFLMLAATHVSMSLLWLSAYAMAVGTLSERMARPRVRRTMEILTGAVLVFLGVRLVLK